MVSMVILIALVNSAVINTMIYRQLLTEYESKGIAISQSIADSASDILLFRDPASIQSLLDQYLTIKGVAYLVLEDAQNNIVAHTFVPQVPSVLRTEYAGKRMTTATTAFHRLPGLGNVYEISQPVLLGEIGTVHVGMSLKPIHHSMLKVAAIMIPILLVVLITALFVFRSRLHVVTRSLVELADYTKHLAGHDFKTSLPEQNSIRSIAHTHNDEVGRLSGTIVSLEDAIINYIGDLERTTAAKQKIESELMIARQIQLGMLPKKTDGTDLETVKIASYLEPAREVGGDFFDHINVGDDAYIVAGDVSGKGVSAALFMALTMMLIKAKAQEHITPGKLMEAVNKLLIPINENMLFVTVFCGKINCKTGVLSYVNAGHPAPMIKRGDNAFEIPLTGGMALGVDGQHSYQENRLELEPNDYLCVYTDGISEAMNNNQELYGESRLLQCIKSANINSANALLEAVLNSVNAFSNGTEQSDDITVLLAHWLPRVTL